MGYKVCTKCNIEKDTSFFSKKSSSPDGLRTYCKQCSSEIERNRTTKLTSEQKEVRNARERQKRKEGEAGKLKEKVRKDIESGVLQCTVCDEIKPLDNFRKRTPSTWSRECKHCQRVRASVWRERNPDYVKPEQTPEQVAEHNSRTKLWVSLNRDRVRKTCASRRASKLQATPKWVDNCEFEQLYIEEVFNLAKLRSDATGVEHHVDHIVPLNSPTVCGLHCSANLQILTAKENLAKGNRWWPNMPDEELMETYDSN